jgi:outer membrane protein insertion porin family
LEVLKEIKNVRLSPLFVLILATVTSLSVPKPVRGETTDSASPSVRDTLPPPIAGKSNLPAVSDGNTQPSPALPQQESGQAPVSPEIGQSNPSPPSEAEKPESSQSPTQEQKPESNQPSSAPNPEQQPESVPSPAPQESPAPSAEETPPPEPQVLVAEIAVTGVEGELAQLVYNTLRTKPGRATTRSQLQEDVNAIYATGYFANVKVIPEDTPLGVRVTFAVQPNPILQRVEVETVPAREKEQILPPEVIQESFGDQYGKILNLRDLQEGIKKLNEWYTKNGYELAQVVQAPKVSEDGVVTLVVAEGVIENVQIRFFTSEDEPTTGKTRDFIITREMQLKPGDVFNRNLAQKDLQRIYGLGLFEDAKFSFSPGEDPRQVVINVDVVEGRTGSLAVGAGYSSTSGLFGTISYQDQNVGGNNQTVGVEFQGGQRELLFNLGFTDPWIAGDPYRTAYSLNAFRSQSISLVFNGDSSSIRTPAIINGQPDLAVPGDVPENTRTGGGVTFFRPIADSVFDKADWQLSLGFLYQNVRVTDANSRLAPLSSELNGYAPQKLSFSDSGVDDLVSISFNVSQDFRDSALQPTSGYFLSLGTQQFLPIGSGSILANRLRANYSYYIPVKWINFDFTKGAQALAFNVQAGTFLGDLPPYEAFVLGGTNSVRGYAEGEVGSGRSYFQATAEYRFPIYSIVAGTVFFDYGTAIGSQGAVTGIPGLVRGLPGWGYAYGVGVRIQSPVGPIRIDFGWNNEGGNRLNFGIGERF